MPELPEVETIARRLRKSLIGKRVVEVRLSGLPLRKPVAADFASRLRKRTIRHIRRRGKYLVLEVEPQGYWLIHLGMSGRICYDPTEHPAKHTHVVICFSDGTELHYRDHRRFGLMALHDVASLDQIRELQTLGKDPLSRGFTWKWLWLLLQKSSRELKSLLLDQHRIAGLGNIYACEALFRARLHPGRRSDSLSRQESVRLVRATRKVLREAIRHRGTSFSDFVDSDGQRGDHQQHLQVYQREGEKCRRCRSWIKRWVQGNRSTFFCPRCQA
jgi:formamidopyrimidine-DNA glycosylase